MPLDMIISPLALYEQDQSIFEGLTLPALTEQQLPSWGDNYLELLRDNLAGMVKDTFVQWLLLQTAEMSTIYPSPSIFKQAITLWSSTRARIWQQLWETQFFRYNPIWNKDGTVKVDGETVRQLANSITRNTTVTHSSSGTTTFGHPTETVTRTGGHSETETDTQAWQEAHTGTDTTTDTLRHSETESFDGYKETHDVTKDDTDGSVAAFDAGTLQPRERTEHQLTETTTPTGSRSRTMGGDPDVSALQHGETVTRTGTSGDLRRDFSYNQGGEVEQKTYSGQDQDSTSSSGSDVTTGTDSGTDTGNITQDTTTLEQGNIGVTSTQELIQKEREILRFNMYEYILQDFKQNFLVMLY